MGLKQTKLDDILSVISKRGHNPVIGTIYQQQAKWLSWYRSDVSDFHYFKMMMVDGNETDCERKTLNMGKRVPEDWTKLLYNKNVNVVLDSFEEEQDDKTKEFYIELNKGYNDILEDNNFTVEFSGIVEKAFAMGTCAMVEFLNNKEIMIDFIIGDMLIITAYRNQTPKGICTINVFEQTNETITHLTFHDLVDGKYIIEHQVFVAEDDTRLGRSANADITKVFSKSEAKEMEKVFTTEENGKITREETRFVIEFETKIPHFQIIKPNVVNNFDLENPMGLSIFANAIDQLKGGDTWYDSFINEPELAKHRIMVDAESVTKEIQKATATGIQVSRPFNKQDTVFLGMNLKGQDKKIEYYNAEIRAEEHKQGINMNMQLLGFNCGMGTDYYAFDARGVYQNEKAVISENSDLWANKVKHEITAIIQPLTGMTKAILFFMKDKGLIEGIEIEDIKITVQTDDSMATDDETILSKMKEDAQDSFIPEWRYVAKRYKLNETEAKQWVAEASEVEEDDGLVPNPDETLEEFVNRFISDEMMMEEFPDEEQRRQVATEKFNGSGS